MKYAKFSRATHPSVTWIYDENDAQYTNSTRVTEWVDIEFPPRAAVEVVPEHIKQLDKEIAGIRAKAEIEAQALTAKRNELLAITQTG